MITGWNKVFVGEIIGEADEDGVVKFVREGSDESEPVEKSRLRRLLKGSEIDHWGADWEGLWLIWPYEAEDNGPNLLSKETLESEYPRLWDFFQNHENEFWAARVESGRMSRSGGLSAAVRTSPRWNRTRS